MVIQKGCEKSKVDFYVISFLDNLLCTHRSLLLFSFCCVALRSSEWQRERLLGIITQTIVGVKTSNDTSTMLNRIPERTRCATQRKLNR